MVDTGARTPLTEVAADAIRQAHGFMHYGTLEACPAGICVQRRDALAAARSATEIHIHLPADFTAGEAKDVIRDARGGAGSSDG